MQYIARYESPLGPMLLAADDAGLTGAWFAGQKYFAQGLARQPAEKQTPPLQAARRWLDAYFAGQEPDAAVPLHLAGTPFQTEVWQLLRAIPYGQTVTYGELAALARERRKTAGGARRVYFIKKSAIEQQLIEFIAFAGTDNVPVLAPQEADTEHLKDIVPPLPPRNRMQPYCPEGRCPRSTAGRPTGPPG